MLPKLSIRLRHLEVLRTAMPTTPVDEYDKFRLTEYEIWRAKHFDVPSPSMDTVLAKQGHNDHLRCHVPTASHRRHNCRSLCLRVNVCHDLTQADSALPRINYFPPA
jgi:hypothetical protein